MSRFGNTTVVDLAPVQRPVELPHRMRAAWFWLRAQRQILLRGWRNRRDPSAAAAVFLADAPILAPLRAPLWDDDSAGERA